MKMVQAIIKAEMVDKTNIPNNVEQSPRGGEPQEVRALLSEGGCGQASCSLSDSWNCSWVLVGRGAKGIRVSGAGYRMGQPSWEERGRGLKFSWRAAGTRQLGLVTSFQNGRLPTARPPPRKPRPGSRKHCILPQAQNPNSR